MNTLDLQMLRDHNCAQCRFLFFRRRRYLKPGVKAKQQSARRNKAARLKKGQREPLRREAAAGMCGFS